MTMFHSALRPGASIAKTLLSLIAMAPFWPVIALMWLVKWATPDESSPPSAHEPIVLTNRLEITQSDECPWCRHTSLRRILSMSKE